MKTPSRVFLALLASLTSCSQVYAALECSLCGNMKTVHNDHQQALFYLAENEVYSTCVDLAVAVLDKTEGSPECTSIQEHFSSDCCTAETTSPRHRRRLFGSSSSSWPTASASTWSSGWNQAPSRPASTAGWTNTFYTKPQKPSSSFQLPSYKPNTAWSSKPKPATTNWFSPPPPAPRPVYRPPPAPVYRPPVVVPNKNVVHSNHPAWGGNNNNASPINPGTTYSNDGMCGICTDPSNPSLGIVVNGFGVGGFSFTGACRDLNAAFRAQGIRNSHQMCNVTLARFRGDCGCGGYKNNAANFFGSAPQAQTTGSWCIKGFTC